LLWRFSGQVRWLTGRAGVVIQGQLQVNSHAKLALRQFLNAHDLGNIFTFTIEGIVAQVKGKVTNTRMPL